MMQEELLLRNSHSSVKLKNEEKELKLKKEKIMVSIFNFNLFYKFRVKKSTVLKKTMKKKFRMS